MKLKLAVCAALLGGLCGVAAAQSMRPPARADANGDGVISRAEMQAVREARFARLDANGDGYISDAERPRRGRRAGALARRADTDRDGRVSHAEFSSQPMRAFDRFDANKDDTLEPAELQAMRNAAQRPRS